MKSTPEQLREIARNDETLKKVPTIALLESANEIERFLAHIAALEEENKRLKYDIRRRELNEYQWQCSGCRHFQKHANSKYRCDKCKRTNYLSGSFKREDLESWFDEHTQSSRCLKGVDKV